jgi:hypothetical protein
MSNFIEDIRKFYSDSIADEVARELPRYEQEGRSGLAALAKAIANHSRSQSRSSEPFNSVPCPIHYDPDPEKLPIP